MQTKLLIIAFLLGTTPVLAQKKDVPAKAIQKPTPVDYKLMGADMPPLKLKKLDGSYVQNKDVNYDANLIVMLFSPLCSHCQEQTKKLEEGIYLFKKTKILLVAAPTMGEYLPKFDSDLNLKQYPTITLGLDSSKIIDNIFLYQSLPQINVYDKNRKLIKTSCGGIEVDSLKQYIQ